MEAELDGPKGQLRVLGKGGISSTEATFPVLQTMGTAHYCSSKLISSLPRIMMTMKPDLVYCMNKVASSQGVNSFD